MNDSSNLYHCSTPINPMLLHWTMNYKKLNFFSFQLKVNLFQIYFNVHNSSFVGWYYVKQELRNWQVQSRFSFQCPVHSFFLGFPLSKVQIETCVLFLTRGGTTSITQKNHDFFEFNGRVISWDMLKWICQDLLRNMPIWGHLNTFNFYNCT